MEQICQVFRQFYDPRHDSMDTRLSSSIVAPSGTSELVQEVCNCGVTHTPFVFDSPHTRLAVTTIKPFVSAQQFSIVALMVGIDSI